MSGKPAWQSKVCARCGARFDCGAGRDSCWCNELPLLPAEDLEPAADCFCPACLHERVAEARARQRDGGA